MCPFRPFAVALRAAAMVVPFLLFGCGQSVTEDRAIHYSADGRTVSFQHGNEGVFVADNDGAGLTRVFQPDETVLATSPPLHSPVDDRLMFLTAQRPDGAPRADVTGLPDPPEGRRFYKEPIRYSCWLREAAEAGRPIEPQKLFTVTCDDVGYVAAGLGARWSPDGASIVYVADLAGRPEQHTLYAFDLKAKSARRIFPHAAAALVFEFSPQGNSLVVAGYDHSNRSGRPVMWSADDWKSGAWSGGTALGDFAVSESFSLLQALQHRLPAWTNDESQTARVEHYRGREADDPGTWLLRLRSKVDGEPTLIQESVHPFRDLHWSTDGQRLGYLEDHGPESGALRVYDMKGVVHSPAGEQPIRRFAGFDAGGTHFAYVVADAEETDIRTVNWSLLLMAEPLARDRVFIADAANQAPPRDLFSGMRVTFPRWSPVEKRLSLWLTFQPRYLSIFSLFRNWGLWRGDPAATLNVETGEITWMAVSPAEELQIGHYYLLKHDYHRAWEWYERASQRLPPQKPPAQLVEALQQFGAPDRPELFQYLCLRKLGRDDEANVKISQFDERFSTELLRRATDPAQQQAVEALLSQFGADIHLTLRLIRDLYMAEVFLSVDALDDAREFFQKQKVGETDEQRLSRMLVISQLLLAGEQYPEYFEFCTNELAPLILKKWESAPAEQPANGRNAAGLFGSLALAPLLSTRFVAMLPQADLVTGVTRWETIRTQTKQNRALLWVDLFLHAAHLRLNDDAAAAAAEKRLAANPELRVVFPSGIPADEIEKLFDGFGGWPLLSTVQ